ncbi:MAG: serine/threonine dehydratase [Ilumatobacteraceae bacterium]|nr:serine/threonine dehydratase [Ilumatobacteraceae bacterium]
MPETDHRPIATVSPDDVERAAESISAHVRTTPIVEVPGQEIGVDATLVLKLEFLQHSGSFKARGAAHFVATQPIATDGIVAASGGNHGAAVAWAARRSGHPAHIFVPTTADPAKVARLRGYGATVHEVGEVYGEAFAASRRYLDTHDATSIHAYDDPVVVAGAGTCARELDQAAPDLDAVVLACGGGGLAGSTAAWYGERTEVVAVETTGTASYAAAVAAGEPVDVDVSGLAADALGAPRIGSTPFRALRAVDATSVVVSDDAVAAARTHLWSWLRIVVEPAAAAPLAALMSGAWSPRSPHGRVGIVLCGANTTLDLAPPSTETRTGAGPTDEAD